MVRQYTVLVTQKMREDVCSMCAAPGPTGFREV